MMRSGPWFGETVVILRIASRLLIGLAALAGVWAAWPARPAVGQPAEAVGDSRPRYMGVATCSSMACHHGNGPKGASRSEYSTWAAYDRHARAFTVLHNERSRNMVRNLYGKDAPAATETKLCLQCHATAGGDTSHVGDRFQLADGVGCEACHGPAEKWLTEHYKPGFRDRLPEDKAKLGLRPITDVAVRAELCITCHVGDGSKEVNHDLIAAGHPRLNFEFAGYHAIYPKHWKEKAEQFETRAWAVGQVMSARAALDLLRVRAEGAEREGIAARPWPEFAEYDCFACHQDLKVESGRKKTTPDRLSSAPWGTWYVSMARQYATLSGDPDAKALGESLDRLTKLMESPSPDSKAVAEESGKAVGILDGWLKREKGRTHKADTVKGYLRGLLEVAPRDADGMRWEQATQLYLALAALHAGLEETGGQPDNADAFRTGLKGVGDRVRGSFPRGFDSPRDFDPAREPRLSEQLKALRGHLGQ